MGKENGRRAKGMWESREQLNGRAKRAENGVGMSAGNGCGSGAPEVVIGVALIGEIAMSWK